MEIKDILFEPHNDIEIDDLNISLQHDNLIKQNKFDDATALLNNENYLKGFRASIFNSIQTKIRTIQEYLLNKFIAEDDEYFSYEEPSEEEMGNKTWWIQPY